MPTRFGRKASPTSGMFSDYVPRQLDAPTLWEAFAGGEFDDWTGGAIEAGKEDYLQRTEALYDVVVGPSFGYTGTEGEEGLLGKDFSGYIATPDFADLERAEREFRLEIGDPYGRGRGGGLDPFRWEQLSRYTPAAAQGLLQRQLYGQGERLGGFAGEEYKEGLETAEETYTTGLTGKREELTYGALTAGAGMEAGTTGAALRTGAGAEQAEDILEEAYKDVRSLEAGYQEKRVGTELDLESSLNTALDRYISALSEEKQDWYQDVLRDVQMVKEIGGAEFGAGEGLEGFGEIFDIERGGEEFGWTQGLWGKGEKGLFWSDEACGIGMLKNEEGVCVPVEGLEEGPSGELISTDMRVACDDGSYAYSEEDCPPPTFQCWNGDMVYDPGACPQEPAPLPTIQPQQGFAPDGIVDEPDPWMPTYDPYVEVEDLEFETQPFIPTLQPQPEELEEIEVEEVEVVPTEPEVIQTEAPEADFTAFVEHEPEEFGGKAGEGSYIGPGASGEIDPLSPWGGSSMMREAESPVTQEEYEWWMRLPEQEKLRQGEYKQGWNVTPEGVQYIIKDEYGEYFDPFGWIRGPAPSHLVDLWRERYGSLYDTFIDEDVEPPSAEAGETGISQPGVGGSQPGPKPGPGGPGGVGPTQNWAANFRRRG